MLVEFVVVDSHPCSEGFLPGSLVFLKAPQKTNISLFQFDLETALDKEIYATANSYFN